MLLRLRRRQPRRLPWPSSKIERDLLHELWIERQETGRPITAIVAEAVAAHLNRRMETTARAAEASSFYDVRPRPQTAA